MEIGKYFHQSFEIYLKNFGLLFLAILVVICISGITLGILAGPLLAGFMALCLKLKRNQTVEFKEIFAHFDQFGPTFLICLMGLGVYIAYWLTSFISGIPFIGSLLYFLITLIMFVAGPFLSFVLVLALANVVDKKMPPVTAVQKAFNDFMSNPFQFWLYSLILSILASLGAILGSILSSIFILIPIIGWLMILPFMMAGISLTASYSFIGLSLPYEELATQETPTVILNQKILQIVSFSLAALILIGLICTLAFPNPYRRTFGLFGSNINTPFGQVTASGNNSIAIKTKNGNLSIGSSLPKNFPNDIPIYPNANLGGYIGGDSEKIEGSLTTFRSNDTTDQISTFYSTTLQTKGWDVSSSVIGDMKTVSAKKAGRSVAITINPREGANDILLSILKE